MKVSVIIPSYNYAWCIEKAIKSVFNQTHKEWELLIVDDGSTDASIEIIEQARKLLPEKVRVFCHPNNENRGLAKSYQLGISNVESDLVAFLEADDYWVEDALQKKIEVMTQYPDVGLVFSKVRPCGCSLSRKIQYRKYLFRCRLHFPSKKPFLCSNIKYMNLIPTFSCVMVRRDLLELETLQVPQGLEPWLDWWLWAQYAKKTMFYYIPKISTYWMRHNESYSNRAYKENRPDIRQAISGLYS